MINIHPADAWLLVAYVTATLLLGLWIGRGSTTLSSFLVGQRSLPWYAVLGSIIATETSAVTFLSIPGMTYAQDGNFSFLQLAMGFVLGRWIAIYALLPLYFEGKIFTAYDVLKGRFGVLTQRTASLIFLLTRTIADGLRLYLTGLVLETLTGLDLRISIAIMGAVTIAYCSAGGIKSVVWNDCIQLIVYLVGAIAMIFVVRSHIGGGFADIVEEGRLAGKFEFIQSNFSFYQSNLWAGIIGGSFISLATHGVDQMMVQRYLCSRTSKDAALALGLSGPLVLTQFGLFLFAGVCLASFYQLEPPAIPLEKDAVMANFIVQEMPIGLCGLTLAAVFSVAMSTLSSSLSSSASAVINDFIKPRHGEAELSLEIDRRLTRQSRIWTMLFGFLQVAVGIVIASTPALSSPSAINQVITIAGLTSGLILGVFAVGMAKREYRERSLLIGMLMGFAGGLIPILAPTESPFKIHGWWTAVIASTITFFSAWLADHLQSNPGSDSSHQ